MSVSAASKASSVRGSPNPFGAEHRLKVLSLYKKTLRLQYDWGVDRGLWPRLTEETRQRFEANRNETDYKRVNALITKLEDTLKEYAHPDPYILPHMPGGSKWQRNLPLHPKFADPHLQHYFPSEENIEDNLAHH